MLLSGDLRGFPPPDLLQWVVTERGDGLLVVSATIEHRLRFQDGLLVGSAHDGRGRPLRHWLVQRCEIGHADAAAVSRSANTADRSFVEELLRSGRLADPWSAARRYVSQAAMELLRETRGRFYFEPAAHPFPASTGDGLDVTQIVLEGMRRLDEERLMGDLLPSDSSLLARVDTADPVLPATARPLSLEVLGVLQRPGPLVEVLDRVAGDPHELRMTVASLVRDGYLEVEESAPVAGELPRPDEVNRLALSDLHCSRPPTAGERLFLTGTEAALMQRLEGAGRRGLPEVAESLELPRTEVVECADRLRSAGLIDAEYRSWRPGGWVAAAALTISLATIWLALGRGGEAAEAGSVDVDRAEVVAELEQAVKRREISTVPRLADALGPPQTDEERAALVAARTMTLEARATEAAVAEGYDALAVGDLEVAREALKRAAAGAPPGAPDVAELERRIESASKVARQRREAAEAESAERRRRLDRLLASARRELAAGRPRSAADALAAAAALDPENQRVQNLLARVLEPPEPPTEPDAGVRPNSPVEGHAQSAAAHAPVSEPPEAASQSPEEAVATVEPQTPPPPDVPPGTLIVNAVPFGFVRLDGREMGVTPQRLELLPGSYRVEIYRDGYRSERRMAEVSSSVRSVTAVVLEPLDVEGSLAVDVPREVSPR